MLSDMLGCFSAFTTFNNVQKFVFVTAELIFSGFERNARTVDFQFDFTGANTLTSAVSVICGWCWVEGHTK